MRTARPTVVSRNSLNHLHAPYPLLEYDQFGSNANVRCADVSMVEPTDTDVQGRFPTCRTQRTHMKNAEKSNACKHKIGCVSYVFPHFRVRALRILVFWSASKTLHGLHTTGWKPAFILLLSRTSNVEGSGWVCWSMRSRLGVWTRVGRSARIIGTVNRPIPAASCSTQYRYLMQVSSKRPCVLPPVPISCLVTMPLKIFVGNVCCLPMPQMKVRALYWSFRPLPRSCLLVQCNSSRLQAPAFQVCGSIPLSGHIFF